MSLSSSLWVAAVALLAGLSHAVDFDLSEGCLVMDGDTGWAASAMIVREVSRRGSFPWTVVNDEAKCVRKDPDPSWRYVDHKVCNSTPVASGVKLASYSGANSKRKGQMGVCPSCSEVCL